MYVHMDASYAMLNGAAHVQAVISRVKSHVGACGNPDMPGQP
jgi:hypothetical protein